MIDWPPSVPKDYGICATGETPGHKPGQRVKENLLLPMQQPHPFHDTEQMEWTGQERPRSRPTAPPRPPPPRSCVEQQQHMDQEPTSAYSTFQKLHDRAFAAVQKGLCADEEGNLTAAEEYYTSSLPLLEEVLITDCENLPGAMPAEIEAAKQMQQKMNKTKLQISYRLESIQSDNQMSALPETTCIMEETETESTGVRLPSYEEAVSLTPSSDVGDAVMTSDDPGQAVREGVSTDGTELFSIADGVQIFNISCEGYVSAPSYPTFLRIVRFQESLEDDTGSQDEADDTQAFLQVGDWLYPLIPGTSPVLHTTYGAYLFPDLSRDGSGSSVGLILPDTMSQEEHHVLEDILRNLSTVQEQQMETPEEDQTVPSAPVLEPQEPSAPMAETEAREEEQGTRRSEERSTSAKISRGILVASSWISWGLGKGAEKAGQLISYGSAKLRDNLQPEIEPRPVDPCIQKGARYARKASAVAVSVSSFVVTKLGEATMALGRQVAPHIRKKGGELLPKSMKSKRNKSRMDGVVWVAASGLQGFGRVWLSLEAAAKALGKNVAKETVATVYHKYGKDAADVAEDTVYAAGNVAMTAYNAESLAVRAIVKRTAKDAGAAVVYDLQETDKQHTDGCVNGTCCDGNGEQCQDAEKKEKGPPV